MTASNVTNATPAKLSSQQKAEQTNTVVREILDAEVNAREKKTEKLRALRLARKDEEAAAKPPAKTKKAAGPT